MLVCDRLDHLDNLKCTVVLTISFVRKRSKLKLTELFLKSLDKNVLQQFW